MNTGSARRMTLVLLAAVIGCGHTWADDWRQWRGNNRDGKSAETGLLDTWPAEGPKLVWQAIDLGYGYSTPSSVDGVVYLISNEKVSGEAETDSAHESVIALSLADGSRVWETQIGTVGENRGVHYPGARSTPTVDDGYLFALGSNGDLACLHAKSGDMKWSKNLQTDFGGKPGNWAYAESPLIDGDMLICSPGGSEATVVALNKSDGSVLWQTSVAESDEASYSSPIVIDAGGEKQYVLFLSKGAIGLDAATGRELWRYRKTADEQANIPTPVSSGEFVYTAAGRVGGGLVKVPSDPSEPTEVYFATSLPGGIGGSVLVNGNLYGSAGQTLMCIGYATGEVKWQDRSIGAASICYADGKLYLHGEENDVAMVAASGEAYTELGRFTPPNAPERRGREKAWTHPIIVDGKLLIRDLNSVWCYDISK